MRPFCAIVQTFVRSVIRSGGQALDRFYVAAQLVGDDDTWIFICGGQALQEPSGSLRVSMPLDKNIKIITVRILGPPEPDEDAHEEDLWFLPEPLEEELDDLPPGPRAEPHDTAVIEDWAKAESVHAARLARVAGRLGALDDRLQRGQEGWRHRLALIEAANLSWFAGDRVSSDRLALWISMRLSGAQDEPNALARVGWAVWRLGSGLTANR